MSNGQPNERDLELIGVSLNRLAEALCCTGRVPKLVEDAIPAKAHPFRIEGSIRGTAAFGTGDSSSSIVTANDITQTLEVPVGFTGVITHLAFTEPYPGALQGAEITLLINGIVQPPFDQVQHGVGSAQEPFRVFIPLQEQDLIYIQVKGFWVPTLRATTFLFGCFYGFIIWGYWLDKEFYSNAAETNEETG